MSEPVETDPIEAARTLEVRLFGAFRQAVGSKTVDISITSSPVTIGAVLRALEAEYGDLDILDSDGEVQEYISVLKNGEDIVHVDGQDTIVEDTDQISLFPPVAGG